MQVFSIEPGRGIVDQEMADALDTMYKRVQATGTFPADPNNPPELIKHLAGLGVISRCKITRLSWEMTVYGKTYPDIRSILVIR